jgi:ATP-dependent exoDNAse (exonuclease V) beta subunit
MTFTNKAANEMKERILKKLIQLSKPSTEKTNEDISELQDMCSTLGLSEEEVTERSEKCLNQILHNYGVFSVMTIDKFTHKVIRTFAKDLGLSVDFDVELDLNTLQKNVCDLLFDQIGRNKDLTRLMLNYADTKLQDDKSWNFKSQLTEFSKELFKEDALKSISLLKQFEAEDFLKAQKDLVSENKIIENTVLAMGTEAMDLIESKNLLAEDFQGKSNSIVTYFKRFADGRMDLRASATLKGYVSDEKWGHTASPNKSTANEIAPLLEKYFNQIEAYLDEKEKEYLLNKEILKNLNNLSLMNYILTLTENLKEEENILLISDFYKKIADIITNEPVPFIYERLGVRYDHFLLDEFQDTSHLQWINMIPLLHNSLSQSKSNLIVGDGKQAIYRWRNGEVEQFIQLPNQIYNPENIASLTEAERTFKNEGVLVNLKDNYRSAPEIVNFNNRLFQSLSDNAGDYISSIYKDGDQNPKKTHKGYIEMNMLLDAEADAQNEYVKSVIDRSIEKGYSLSDICILARTNKIGAAVAKYLSEHGIAILSQDSLFVGKDRTVKLLFNLMSSLALPNSINYKMKCAEHFSAVLPGVAEKCGLWEAPSKLSTSEGLKQAGYNLNPQEQTHSFYEYVEHLIEILGLTVTNNPYLQYFLEQVHNYEKRSSTNIHSFISWFNDKGRTESISSPEGAKAVNVMTIHKAKGLEFPIVICPHLEWDMSKNKSKKWISDEESAIPAYFLSSSTNTKKTKHEDLMIAEDDKSHLDFLNMLYVAFTRPEIALFASADTKNKSLMARKWILPFLEDSTSKGLMENNETIFTSGEFVKAAEKDLETKVEAYHFEFLKQRMDKPALSYKSAENWDINDLDEKRRYGTELHLILSKLEKASDVDVKIEEATIKKWINHDNQDRIREDVIRLFENEHFKKYFDSEVVMNEKIIINEEGRKYIPDKIIKSENETLVVDFKTGKPADSHIQQIKDYKSLLEDLGLKNVHGELFYTEDCLVKEV